MPPLAEVNALGKVLMVEAEEPLKGETEENLIKAADLVEIDSLIKTGPKVKIGFVPGMEKKNLPEPGLLREPDILQGPDHRERDRKPESTRANRNSLNPALRMHSSSAENFQNGYSRNIEFSCRSLLL